MSLFLKRYRFSACIVLLMGIVVPQTAAQPMSSAVLWAQAWPMVGHDPQQTARSSSSGPLRPHLLWTYRGMDGPPLIGPDGSVYGWRGDGLTALTALGKRRWLAAAQEFLGGPPALGADGLVRVAGQLLAASGTPESGSEPHIAIFALSSAGRPVWVIRSLPWATMPQSVPFSKGMAPLVTAANVLYVPFAGPVYRPGENDGMEVVAPAGRPVRRLLAGFTGPIAVAAGGTVYQLGGDSQGHTALRASRSDGMLLWSQSLRYEQRGNVLVGRHGVVYVSDGMGVGPGDRGELAAYSPAGRLLWRLRMRAGSPSLAERGDGVVLIADRSGLGAISPGGRRMWQRALGRQPATGSASPSIAVDAAGRVYIGTSDGFVRAVTPDGILLWTLPAGGPTRDGEIPSLAIGPTGTLAVTGTDGVLRLYG